MNAHPVRPRQLFARGYEEGKTVFKQQAISVNMFQKALYNKLYLRSFQFYFDSKSGLVLFIYLFLNLQIKS